MPLKDYFSKDVNKRIRFVFNLIASVYAWADAGLVKGYAKAARELDKEIGIKGKTVLDLGTGTGAWAAALHRQGALVTGADISEKMIAVARRKHPEIEFVVANAEEMKQFKDNSFDIVTATFVMHGVKAGRRQVLLAEMIRMASQAVVIHDFYGKTAPFIQVLEFLEQSDYKNFKKNFIHEFTPLFSETKIISKQDSRALYVGIKKPEPNH